MSIAKFQSFVTSKGCAGALGITMALVFLVSSTYQCSQASRLNEAGQRQQSGEAVVVATVAGKPVLEEEIQRAIDGQRAQMQGMSLPPEQDATFTSYAITGALNAAAMRTVAEKNGVQFTPEAIQAAFEKDFQDKVDQFRQQLEMSKRLKPGATDAEFEAEVQKETKKSLKQIKDESWKQISDALADPAKKDLVQQSFAQPLLLQALAAKLTPSDSELRSTYDNLVVKRVLLKDEAGKSAITEAERIKSEISGGLKFEDAMNRYSKDVPLPNKRVSENTLNITGRQFSEDAYRPLAGLKPNDVSVPVTTPEGVVIYKVVSIKSDIPADFEKSKQKYAQQVANERAGAEVRRQSEAILKGSEVKWQSPAYEALFRLGSVQTKSDPKARQAELEAISKLAEEGLKTAQGGSRRFASLALLGALQQLASTPGVDPKALLDRRVSAINSMLETAEDGALRMQLVDLYVEKGDKTGASDALLKAAQYNSDYTTAGQSRYSDMQAKIRSLTANKMLDEKVVPEIQKELQRWVSEKATYEKQAAEQRKADEEAAKKASADAAKAKASGDVKKEAPQSDYSPSSPAGSSPAPGKTGN